MKRWLGLAALAAAVSLAIAGWLSSRPTSRFLADFADLLSTDQEVRVAAYHERLLKDFDIDYRVATAKGVSDLDRFTESLFDEESIGGLSSRSRGLLLVIDPATDRVRLEVGYTLEPIFTDAFVSYIERQQMVPFFRAGRLADGILATTELIVQRADEASQTFAWVKAQQDGSGGGGAKTMADIGSGQQKRRSSESDAGLVPGPTPEATLEAYLVAMASHNDSASLPIYTADTQAMLRNWTMTPAQMDNVVQTTRNCSEGIVRTNDPQVFAVVRYPRTSRKCPPYFLRRIGGVWRLDLATQKAHIRFNNRNYWRFIKGAPTNYAFAFDDWEFDRHGFPH